jgi:hypothetical protein
LTLTLTKPIAKALPDLYHWAFGEIGMQTSIFIPVSRFGRAKSLARCWFPTEQEVGQAYNLRAQSECRPFLLNLGISEYCKQYQMTICYLRADGALAAYAGGPPIATTIPEKHLGRQLEENYACLAFSDMVNGRVNTPATGECYRCAREEFCFGTPICRGESKCSFRIDRQVN